MKKSLLIGLLTVGMGTASQAALISGGITFGGTVQLNTASAGTATQVDAWHNAGGLNSPEVLSRDGDFAAFVPVSSNVTFVAPWTFASGPVLGFWTVGGFTFDLIESHIFAQGGTPPGVVVNGTGTLSGHGFTPTPGTWSFSTQDPSATTNGMALFSFSAATGAVPAVPDGGSTIALLGFALVGVEALRRKMRTAK